MKHHYIPQFLLSKWSGGSADKTLEVFRLDLHKLVSDRHTPEYTGYEDDLYALSESRVASMARHDNESKYLSPIDDKAANVLQKLETGNLKTLTPSERNHWARFLMSLRVRQPSVISELISENTRGLFRKSLESNPYEYEKQRQKHDPASFADWAENQHPGMLENFGISILSKIIDNQAVGQRICNMRWWIWDFTGAKHDLLLGDNPLILTSSIEDSNLILALPISPAKVFMATQSDKVVAILKTQEISYLATRLNESSVTQSESRIYARNKKHWRFIENRKF